MSIALRPQCLLFLLIGCGASRAPEYPGPPEYAPLPQQAAPAEPASPAPVPPAYTAVTLDGFAKAGHYYSAGRPGGYPKYRPEQIVEIAENLLLLQRENGSWPADMDPSCIFTEEERAKHSAGKTSPITTFDNHNMFPQVEYLAAVYTQTKDDRHRQASLRGLQFVVAHQVERCGGWPHTVPASEPHHALVTIADQVTTGVLSLLRSAETGGGHFAFVDPTTRQRVAQARQRGDECLLRLQVVQRGQPTGWAGQYHPVTLAPAGGRSYELPSIVAQDTVSVVRYLMSIPDPSPEVRRAVHAAAAWLDSSKLTGLRLEEFPAPLEVFEGHKLTKDRRLVKDPAAPPLWARFYDLANNSVVLANRDGKRVAQFTGLARERRIGFHWYGTWADTLLSQEYPAWKAK